MAEHFYGLHHTVYTSNGGAEEMLKGWIGISENMVQTQELREVVLFLENQSGAFHLDVTSEYFPSVFNSLENLKVFSSLIIVFAEELQNEKPNLTCDIDWDVDLRMMWLAQMSEIYEIVKNILEIKGIKLNDLQPHVNSFETQLYEFHKTAHYYHELCSREKKGKLTAPQQEIFEKKLCHLNSLISYSMTTANIARSIIYLIDRADIYLDMNRKEDAIRDLNLVIDLDDDDQGKKDIMEFIDSLG